MPKCMTAAAADQQHAVPLELLDTELGEAYIADPADDDKKAAAAAVAAAATAAAVDDEQPSNCQRGTILGATFVTMLSTMGTQYSGGVYLPALLDEFGQSRARTSLVHSLIQGFLTASGLLVGPLVRRFGHRRVIISGGLLLPIALLLSSVANSLELMMVLACFLGVGVNLAWNPAVSFPTLFFEENRAFALGVANSASGLGAALLAIGIHAWTDQFGWRNAMRIQASLCFGTVMMAAPFFIPPRSKKSEQKQERNGQTRRGFIDLTMFDDPMFVLLWFALFFNAINLFIPYAHVVKHAEDVGLDGKQAASVVSMIGFWNCVGRFSQGVLADRCGLGRTLVFSVSQALCGVVVFGLIWCKTWTAFVVWSGFFGFFSGCYIAMFAVMVADVVGAENTPIGVGLAQLGYCVGNYIAVPTAGYIFDVEGSYNAAWVFCGGAGLVAGALSAALPAASRRYPHRAFGELARKKGDGGGGRSS